ncbi:MAG TPA: DNA repair protein RadC [Puia sp.]|nr:DNA repair protein RadC [Puia sp.]
MITPSKEPRIQNRPKDDSLRECLPERMPREMSNAELLALLIGPGKARSSCLELACKVLASVKGRLSDLSKKSIWDLMQIPGIGRAKASAIYAFAELSRRRETEAALERIELKDASKVAAFLRPIFRDLDHEEFGVLFLDQANDLIDFEIVSQGGITSASVDPRLIFKKALARNAVGIIVAHNHPSGNTMPSPGDKDLTQKLMTGSKYVYIKLLDHIIITEKTYYSFADEGLL